MKPAWRDRYLILFPAAVLQVALVGGCDAPPGGPGAFPSTTPALPDAGRPDASAVSGVCAPARASEDLRARVSLTGATTGTTPAQPGMPGVRVVQTAELFQRFNTICGRCHVSTTNGGMHTAPDVRWTSRDLVGRHPVEDPQAAMPPKERPSPAAPTAIPSCSCKLPHAGCSRIAADAFRSRTPPPEGSRRPRTCMRR